MRLTGASMDAGSVFGKEGEGWDSSGDDWSRDLTTFVFVFFADPESNPEPLSHQALCQGDDTSPLCLSGSNRLGGRRGLMSSLSSLLQTHILSASCISSQCTHEGRSPFDPPASSRPESPQDPRPPPRGLTFYSVLRRYHQTPVFDLDERGSSAHPSVTLVPSPPSSNSLVQPPLSFLSSNDFVSPSEATETPSMSGFLIKPNPATSTLPKPVFLPDELLDALDKDPPSTSSSVLPPPLPPGAAYAHIGARSARSTSSTSSLSLRDDEPAVGRLRAVSSRTSLGPYDIPPEGYDQNDPHSAHRGGIKEKASLWKSVSISGPKGTSARTKKMAVAAWASLGGGGGSSSSQPSPSRNSVASDSTIVIPRSRPPSANRMRSPTTTKAAGSKWLYEAQAATADLVGIERRRSFLKPTEGDSFGSVDEGRPEDEAEESSRGSVVLGDEEEDVGIEGLAVDPWRERREGYTHDLSIGVRASEYEEAEEDVSMLAKPSLPPLEDIEVLYPRRESSEEGSNLYSRRRHFDSTAPPRIAIQTESETSNTAPSTAPMFLSQVSYAGSLIELDPESVRVRSKSDGHLDLAQEKTQAALRNLLAGPEPILAESPTEVSNVIPLLLLSQHRLVVDTPGNLSSVCRSCSH